VKHKVGCKNIGLFTSNLHQRCCTIHLCMSVPTKKALLRVGLSGFCYGDLNRDRTCDPYPVKIVLSQLSYQIIM
jgi:hypothetical protein